MVDVIRFSLGFNNPHRDRRISQMALVEVKDSFFSDNIQNLFHYKSSSLIESPIETTRLYAG